MASAEVDEQRRSDDSDPVARLGRAIDALYDLEPELLDDRSLHDAVIGLQRLNARFAGARAPLVQEWNARRCWADNGSLSPAARLRRDCGLAQATASRELRTARRLRTMDATRAALVAGELSTDHIDLLCRLNQPRTAALFDRDEKILVDDARELSFSDFARVARYWQQAADDATEEDRAHRQVEDRHFSAVETFEGTFDVSGTLDPVSGAELCDELDRIEQELLRADRAAAVASADGTKHLGRTPRQRRADALVEMARRSRAAAEGAIRPRPLITIVTGLEGFTHVCETAQGTPIHRSLVVPLLADADIERIIFDGPDRLIAVGRKRRFSGALRRAIEIRDRTCQHPSGCDVPAWRCDGDHIQPHSRDGATTFDNGRLLCARHNRHPDLRDPTQRPPPPDDG